MIVIAIVATLCRADGWIQIEEFGRAKQAWLKQVLKLPNGIPSYVTFGRVFSLLQPEAFEACFRDWVEAIREVIPGELIAIAEQIVAQGGRYVLALKGNQSTLATEVEEAFIEAGAREYTDVAFREDASRVRDPEARKNPALIRRVALTRLQHDDRKLGIQRKRLKAGWDERYLASLLFEAPKISLQKTAAKGSNIGKT
ncbi:hypothetical protein ThimaDRAFT_3196 [Thiocapsa marina 5811]|uniref:H repeat-associated protein N-terminal domain-containing protein n=2 Tax=Thiocapsa marina TaxID=244573 RepID=F9UE94_9GAMM|nr:hypothetical protein ThimaDRAFT_3196 [Thiocapsa marina 5811]